MCETASAHSLICQGNNFPLEKNLNITVVYRKKHSYFIISEISMDCGLL